MEQFFNTLASNLWGLPMMVFLLVCGIYFTVRSRFFQFTQIGLIMRNTLLTLFKKDKAIKGEGTLTPFQAISTALAGTVGNGNIAGVAAAIAIGGPGAIFWMWLIALVGMVTKMAEVTLAVHFRQKDADGNFYGGPMYYIEKGLGKSWIPLAKFFALSAILGSLGTAVLAQPHTMGVAMETMFGIPPLATAVVAVILTALVIFGGFKRIGQVCERLVPFMAGLYVFGGLVVILANIQNVPSAFAQIFTYAFQPAPAVGGFAGSTLMLTIQRGMSRGMFSNEAGMGSAPMVHATAQTDHPVRQGMWGAFEVFIDTIVVCTITGLAIVTSGVWNSGLSGAELTFSAFSTVWGTLGVYIVSIGVVLFAFSTMVGYTIEFETSVAYLMGSKAIPYMRVVYLIPPILGAGKPLEMIWLIVDISTGIMAIPNLIGVVALTGVFVKLIKDFLQREGISKTDKANVETV